jgi:hypothetical protein
LPVASSSGIIRIQALMGFLSGVGLRLKPRLGGLLPG